MNERAKEIIRSLGLIPHREGGHFREIYRSEGKCEVSHETGAFNERNYSTAIYFLLNTGEKNLLHRIKSDEVWHFYEGSPLKIFEITAEGELRINLLGVDFSAGEQPVIVIRAGNWFCAQADGAPDSFTLAGCTVSPGFDFADFELADAENLSREFPRLEEFIKTNSPQKNA